jgi:hypothetical protein
MTPLHHYGGGCGYHAVVNAGDENAKLLLEAGADTNITDNVS